MNLRTLIKQARIHAAKAFGWPASFAGSVPVYAQGKEDVILLRIFGMDYAGYHVDVGANNGIFISNTYALYRRGWRGICIEPNPEAFAGLAKARHEDVCLNIAVASEPDFLQLNWQRGITEGSSLDEGAGDMSARVEVKTLDSVLRDNRVPKNFDLLSIDVEGHEIDVLNGMNWEAYRPHLVLVEYNGGGVVNADAVEFLFRLGYRPIFINRWNMIFSSQWEKDILRVHKGQTWFQFDRGGI